jgi:hypothetical protein
VAKHRTLLALYAAFIFWGCLYTYLDAIVFFMAAVSAIYYARWIEREQEVREFNEEVEQLLNGTH